MHTNPRGLEEQRERSGESRDGNVQTQDRVAGGYSRVKYYLSIRNDFHSSNTWARGNRGGQDPHLCAARNDGPPSSSALKNVAGTLPTGGDGYTLPAGREVKTEIPDILAQRRKADADRRLCGQAGTVRGGAVPLLEGATGNGG